MHAFLTIAAVILVIIGVVRLVEGRYAWGIGLLLAACLVGPAGISIFT
jgi:hypothetical protein